MDDLLPTPIHEGLSGSKTSGAELNKEFYSHFWRSAKLLQIQIERLDETSTIGGERQDALDHCLASISRLTSEVQDAMDFIPAYDQRAYSKTIEGLKTKFQDARLRLAPKSRFTFKIKKRSSALSLTDAFPPQLTQEDGASEMEINDDVAAHPSCAVQQSPLRRVPNSSEDRSEQHDYNIDIEGPETPGITRFPSFTRAKAVTISDHRSLHIILPSSAARATTSGSLTNLHHCIVDMSIPTVNGKPFAGLAMKDISNSLIIAGQVNGAAHITNVADSIIVVLSRQVRMHDCKNVDVYLFCLSRPIIEDCENMRFAPIPECYASEEWKNLQNHWDQVDDFKWLKVDHSPNWCKMPEEDRIQNEIWTEVVPGQPGKGPADIMRQVGLTPGQR